MAKTAMPYSASLGTGIPNQKAGAGTPVSRTVCPQPSGSKTASKTAKTNHMTSKAGSGANW